MDLKGRKAILLAGVIACAIALVAGVSTTQPGHRLLNSLAASRIEPTNDRTRQPTFASEASAVRQVSTDDVSAVSAGPIARSHNLILQRAQRGDFKAACQHAVELSDCALRGRALESADQIQAAMATGGASTDDKAVSTVAALLNDADRKSAACAGVTEPMLDDAFELQRIASRKGREQARWLATNPALDPNVFLNSVDRWVDYKKIAKTYFDEALRSKRLEDLSALLLVHFPGELALPRPPYRDPDAARFLALYEVAVIQGMKVPSEIAVAAQAMRGAREGAKPLSGISNGWIGDSPKSVEQGISKSMFPNMTKNFCN